MRCRFRADRGTVTAEFAVVLPAVVLVLVIAVGALQLAAEQLRLQDAVAVAARLLGRGDPGANEVVREVSPAARLTVSDRGALVCVDARQPASLGIVVVATLTASACSLNDSG
jgi:hypothetical protein